jgi:hypothetical protein
MSTPETWDKQFSVETSASPEAIWRKFRDVPGWKRWNAGIEAIELEGPFQTGSWFTMKPPGQDAFRSQLIYVRENEGFIDETCIGDLIVQVAHRINSLPARRTRITYSVHAQGAGAAEIGPAISSDFPDVLAALVAHAERDPTRPSGAGIARAPRRCRLRLPGQARVPGFCCGESRMRGSAASVQRCSRWDSRIRNSSCSRWRSGSAAPKNSRRRASRNCAASIR